MRMFFIMACLCFCQQVFGQQADTSHRQFAVTGIISRNTMEFHKGNVVIAGNNPMNVGVGFSKNHSMLNLELNVGIPSTASSKYGKTKAWDVQIRQYKNHLLLDGFLQKYTGFYQSGQNSKTVTLFPEMGVLHIGVEGNYLLNKNYSGKAAWGLFDKQQVSGGTFVVGGGMHYFRFHDSQPLFKADDHLTNMQAALSGGYAYSWVISSRVLWSSLATGGVGVGYTNGNNSGNNVSVNPVILARSSVIYHKNDWESAFSMIIQTKAIQGTAEQVNMNSLHFRIYLVRYIR